MFRTGSNTLALRRLRGPRGEFADVWSGYRVDHVKSDRLHQLDPEHQAYCHRVTWEIFPGKREGILALDQVICFLPGRVEIYIAVFR